MTPEKLIRYELPSWTEYCSIGWVQSIIAWYYGKKTMRKWYRYQNRLKREVWLKANIFSGCDCKRCQAYHKTQVKNVIRLKDRK